MLANLMDSSGALAPKKKAGIVKTSQKLETAKIHAIVPKVAAILNRGHPYMQVLSGTYTIHNRDIIIARDVINNAMQCCGSGDSCAAIFVAFDLFLVT